MPDPSSSPELTIRTPATPLPEDVEAELARQLAGCRDLAFAYLTDVHVAGHGGPTPTLFVWVGAAAMGSLRAALNLVCRTVGRTLPGELFLDVVILNSAPELLDQVERNGRLLVERDAAEHRLALAAASAPDVASESDPAVPWWWPFGRSS